MSSIALDNNSSASFNDVAVLILLSSWFGTYSPFSLKPQDLIILLICSLTASKLRLPSSTCPFISSTLFSISAKSMKKTLFSFVGVLPSPTEPIANKILGFFSSPYFKTIGSA